MMGVLIRWADDLIGLLGGASGPNRRVDWSEVASKLGTDVPADFKRFSEVDGPGEIQGGIVVTSPTSVVPALDFVQYSLGTSEDFRRYGRELAEKEFPYLFHPEPGGLIGWGYSGEGSFFWKSVGEPDGWTVVAMEVRGPGWFEFDGGMAEFLVKLIQRELVVDFLFEDGDDRLGPSFRGLHS